MEYLQRIRLLRDRLHRLEVNDRNNYGVCQKIRREIETLEREVQEKDSCPYMPGREENM